MKKRNFLFSGFLATAIACFAWSAKVANLAPPKAISPAATSSSQSLSNTNQEQSNTEIPVHIVYGILFRELLAIKKEASAREAKGESAENLRQYPQRHLQLDSQQAQTIQTIAEQYTQEVAPVDKEARRIIGSARARFPHGEMPAGATPPAPPDSLKPLEAKRTELLLKTREQVRAALGETTFQRFDDFVRQDIAKQMQTVTLATPRP
jgi:hypothetical protein